jgi:hypothetical protein
LVHIDTADGHLEPGDTMELGTAGLFNEESVELSILGIATATIPVGGLQFLDFQSDVLPIGSGGQTVVDADVYVDATILFSGLATTSITTAGWVGTPLPFTVNLETSACVGDLVSAGITGTYSYELCLGDVSETITLDFIISFAGEVRWLPEPTFCGLITMGVCGAVSWLRRRRAGKA